MKNLAGIIKSGFDNKSYAGLLKNRPDYMLPFGSRYRIVDACLSNFNEYGIYKVLLQGDKNIKSTLDHVSNGEHWDMDLREDGLAISVPGPGEYNSNNRRMYSYYSSISFINEEFIDNIYIANPMVVSRINIESVYEDFMENDYDVMFLYRKQEDHEGKYINSRKVIFDEDGEVQNIGVNLGTDPIFNLFMDHILIKKKVYIDLVTDALERDNAYTLTQAIMNNKEKLNIGSYEIINHVEYIKDLNSFYDANINLLNEGIYTDLFLMGSGILTKNKDEPSTFYGEGNYVKNSLVANGSFIFGSVENSILFRQVNIDKNAQVKDSIIFQGAIIEEGAYVENAILDKNVIIRSGVRLIGDKHNPIVVEKNKILEK